MVRFLAVFLSFAYALPGYSQPPTIHETTELRRDLSRAFEPLKALNDQQMAAVAGLVLASRAGLPVDEYCPPLRKIDVPERAPCLGAMMSYASAVRGCKKAEPTWKECPKVREAEANWVACSTAYLMTQLRDLKLVDYRPKPGPQPKPVTR